MIAGIILDLCFAFTAQTLPDVSRLTYHVDLESQRYLVLGFWDSGILGFWDELVFSFETNKALTEKNRIKRKA
ncbi:MAG: hypothetical protein HOA39_10385 [Gammaproteobacteria bacterium]|jgi:hypothetical protein|nr:hypothetical protein [Gammaproteobacteria bacterium]MBT7885634.1 hypothetical protein [Gammaproteobacteria bacterium]MDO7572806.1 hypothetical protein [Pseudomonadales bacterium]